MKMKLGIVLAILVALVIGSPIAMSFAGCAGMGQTCEAPCAAGACAVLAPTHSMAPDLVTQIELQVLARPRASLVASLEPPPKLFPVSA